MKLIQRYVIDRDVRAAIVNYTREVPVKRLATRKEVAAIITGVVEAHFARLVADDRARRARGQLDPFQGYAPTPAQRAAFDHLTAIEGWRLESVETAPPARLILARDEVDEIVRLEVYPAGGVRRLPSVPLDGVAT